MQNRVHHLAVLLVRFFMVVFPVPNYQVFTLVTNHHVHS